jgi:hypothetical protein
MDAMLAPEESPIIMTSVTPSAARRKRNIFNMDKKAPGNFDSGARG